MQLNKKELKDLKNKTGYDVEYYYSTRGDVFAWGLHTDYCEGYMSDEIDIDTISDNEIIDVEILSAEHQNTTIYANTDPIANCPIIVVLLRR